MIITDILDMIYDEHQLQFNKRAKEIYPQLQYQIDLSLFITGYIAKPVKLKKHRLTAMNMCYIAYIMVLEGEYYG